MSAPPKRKPAPVARKSSAAIPATSFYTGPTVPKQGKPEVDTPVTPLTAENLQQFLRETDVVPPTTLVVDKRTPLRRAPRSHRWLNTTILLVLLTSLFSLYACPPPNSTTAEPSLYTKLNPFIATPHLVPAWESIVCKPTNAYRTQVLEPYVVPHVQRRIRKIRGNPIVRDYLEPTVVRAQVEAHSLWKKRLEQPVRRASLAVQHLHKRYLAPQFPIVRARWNRLVAYIRYKLAHAYTTISRTISTHPTYTDFQRRLSPIYETAKLRTTHAYHSLIPHVSRARKNAEPHVWRIGGQAYSTSRRGVHAARENVLPRVARTLETGLDRVEVAWERLVTQLRQLYATRVHPLLHPHISSVEPHVTTFTKRIYEPYLRGPLDRARPLLYSLILTPSYTDIRRAIRAGYLDTRAAVEQGVENVKEKINAVEGKVESVVDDVKAKVVPAATDKAMKKARLAQQAASESSARASASISSASRAAAASVGSVTDQVGNGAARATGSVMSAAGEAESTVSSIIAEVSTGAQSVASGVSAQGAAAGSTAAGYARGAVNSVADEAYRVSASIQSAASAASASGASVADRVARSAGSVAAEASQGVQSATSDLSAGVHGAASGVSASGSSIIAQATRSAGSVVSAASENVGAAASSLSEGAYQASASVASGASQASAAAGSAASHVSTGVQHAGEQAVASGSSVVDHARHGASQAAAQASQSVGSVAGAAQGAASSISSRAASAVEPNTPTLDPLDPSATEFGSNPGKTTVPHNADADQVREQVVRSDDEVVPKDAAQIKQEAAKAVHGYLKTQVQQISQDRLLALERDAMATTRAFAKLLGEFELSAEAKDVGAERAKVKASLKKVRSRLDDIVATLDKDLQDGLIDAGAKEEVNKFIDAAVKAVGSHPPSTLRQSYNVAVKSVLATLRNVNEAIAQEGRLLIKPYRKDAKDRADQALALLDGKATAAVIPTATVGRVAESAAGTIGRAKDQIIADIKHATEAGSSVFESVTEGAASAASTGVGKVGLEEQAEAVLAGLADFRNQVNQVVEDVTNSGKAGAASATQAIKDEL